MPLNINAKTIFLTYSQVNDDDGRNAFLSRASAHHEFIAETLRAPLCYRLGRESHQDGGCHFHVYVAFDSPVRIQSQSRLDFGGHHPNIQSVRTGHRRVWDYAGKADDIIAEFGEPPAIPQSAGAKEHDIWSAAVSAETEAEFYQTLREGAPKYFVTYHRALEYYAQKYYARAPEPYASPALVDLSRDRLESWTNQAAIGLNGSGHRRRSLILWGPTRTGKTVWARSLGESRSPPAPPLRAMRFPAVAGPPGIAFFLLGLGVTTSLIIH